MSCYLVVLLTLHSKRLLLTLEDVTSTHLSTGAYLAGVIETAGLLGVYKHP